MVTGNVMDTTSITFIPLKPTRGAFDGVSRFLSILIS